MRNAAYLFYRATIAAVLAPSLVACAAVGATDYKLGMAYYDHGVYWNARGAFLDGVRAGNADCMNMMGWYWANGLGHLPKDTIQACNWYAEAAQKGLPDAINNLGTCYEYPGFTQHNLSTAALYYGVAASKGSVKGQQNLDRLRVLRPDLVPAAAAATARQATPKTPDAFSSTLTTLCQPGASVGLSVSASCVAPGPSHAPARQAAPATAQPAVQSAPPQQQQQPQQATSSTDWVGLATAVLNVFVAVKGYSGPPPAFSPPRGVQPLPPPPAPVATIHTCTTTALGGVAQTNCY